MIRTVLRPTQRSGLIACLAALAWLTACGGGGSSDDDAAGGPPAPAPTLTLAAAGSSARTVSLGWTAVADAQGYRLERQGPGGAWTAVGDLAAPARRFVDDGLTPQTTYAYRVTALRASQNVAAEGSATTNDAVAITTPVGAAIGTAQSQRLGAAGGRISSADGRLAVDVPAGAFVAETELSLQASANTAPDGRGDALRLRAAVRPGQPLALSMGYDADEADDADGLGLAIQRGDGSWLSLPIVGVDKTNRRLHAVLPVELIGSAAPLAAGRAGTLAAEPSIELDSIVVRFLNLRMSPRAATLPVGSTQLLVPYARTRVQETLCDDDELFGCLPMPVVDSGEVPFTNSKTGYSREWRVQDVVGGNAGLGTVQPRSGIGAVYTAPSSLPQPNPVTVSFRSTHQRSGRTVELKSRITVQEERWTGTVHGYLGAADLAFTFSAQAVWTKFPGTDRFEANGTQTVGVVNITCFGSASPATVPLPAGALVIDRSVSPPSYTLDVGGIWTTTITASCPGHGSGSVGWDVPGRLITSGTVSGNGTKIEGQATMNGIVWDWALSSEL